jgi:hypothetical protein
VLEREGGAVIDIEAGGLAMGPVDGDAVWARGGGGGGFGASGTPLLCGEQ